MSETNKENRPRATLEMRKFWAELNDKQRERNEEQVRRSAAKARLIALNNEIAKATVGYGLALKALGEKKEELEQELVSESGIVPYFDMAAEFRKKFGIDPYQIELYFAPTEEDVKNANS